jgi:hypothetical protein
MKPNKLGASTAIRAINYSLISLEMNRKFRCGKEIID